VATKTETGLSTERLALVQRYMLDAAEAQARALSAPEPKSEQPEVADAKALAKAERRAAKEAARFAAALDKKEARERKALAKAAARRKGEGTLTRTTARP
jgi:hypothetical protein